MPPVVNTVSSRRALARWASSVTGLPIHQWATDLPRPAAGVAPSAYVSVLRLEGPTARGTWSRDLQCEVVETATLTIESAAALVGGYVSVLVNNRRVSSETLVASTVPDVRDGLLALLVAEDEVSATFVAQGADEILITPTSLGSIQGVGIVGDLTLTEAYTEATITQGLCHSRVRLMVHQPAGLDAVGYEGPDAWGATLLAELKEHTTKDLFRSWGIVPDGRGRELQTAVIRDGGASEVRAFFDLYYSERGRIAKPANPAEEISEFEGSVLPGEFDLGN